MFNDKYIKYKSKYIDLKNEIAQVGGASSNVIICDIELHNRVIENSTFLNIIEDEERSEHYGKHFTNDRLAWKNNLITKAKQGKPIMIRLEHVRQDKNFADAAEQIHISFFNKGDWSSSFRFWLQEYEYNWQTKKGSDQGIEVTENEVKFNILFPIHHKEFTGVNGLTNRIRHKFMDLVLDHQDIALIIPKVSFAKINWLTTGTADSRWKEHSRKLIELMQKIKRGGFQIIDNLYLQMLN
jgi:hypothetical protein